MPAGEAVPARAGGPGSRVEKKGDAEAGGGEKEASPGLSPGIPEPGPE